MSNAQLWDILRKRNIGAPALDAFKESHVTGLDIELESIEDLMD